MSLTQLIDNRYTDKDTTHSYLDTYESLFSQKKDSATNVLEVGIQHGGSIKLWSDYFTNATIYGLDVATGNEIHTDIKNNERIKLFTRTDAYDSTFFSDNLLQYSGSFDILIDDGPHTLESMMKFIALYTQLLTDDGVLVIEDVQDINWAYTLKERVPNKLREYVEIYDLRGNKNRYDDILFVINKSKKLI